MKKYVPFIIGIGQVQRELTPILREIEEKKEGFIVSHNEPKAVLMSLKRYEQLKGMEEARAKEEEEILDIVSRGDKEFTEGKTITTKSLKTLL